MAQGPGIEFDIEAPDLRSLLQQIREVEPRLATALRRKLRESGHDIIEAQRRILESGQPGGGDPTKPNTDLRATIAAGLRTKVVAGKTRQGIDISTGGPRDAGYNMAKVWQKRDFRHPIFGSNDWVTQQGQPYFFEPIKQQMDRMRKRIADAVDETLRRLEQG